MILDQHYIRNLIKDTVNANAHLFENETCFITRFGEPGKSGDLIFYEFCHASESQRTIKEPWEVSQLPPKSKIVFVDDLIGTGIQSRDYIQTRLSAILAPSHEPFLFAICGTSKGIEEVKKYTTFNVLCALELKENQFNYYDDRNITFSESEKVQLRELNERLGENMFAMGLLLTFYYSAPDNAMSFLWKENFASLANHNGNLSWVPLFPRNRSAQ